MKNDKYYMNLAIKEAKKADRIGEIPVGAIIVDQFGNILAKAYNTKESKKISINHAEINAIIKANKKINNWRLNECIMYVTLEPCEMCKKAIEEARISKVVYSSKNHNNKNYSCKYYELSDDSIRNITNSLLNDSFKSIRNN